MNSKLIGFLVILTSFASTFINATDKKTALVDTLQDAESFLIIAPERSYTLLKNNADLAALDDSEQLRWHVAFVKASRSQRDYKQMRTSLENALRFKHSSEYSRALVELLKLAGILLRNSGDISNAKLCYLCALQQSPSTQMQIALLANYAIALVHQGNFIDAQTALRVARALAKDMQSKIQLAKIENSLGVIAFELKNYEQAISHFTESYQLHLSISKRDSALVVGINILFSAVIVNQPELFLRILPNVSRLAENSESKAIGASLLWVKSAFENANGHPVDNNRRAKLTESFSLLANDRVRGYYKQYLAEQLGVKVFVDATVKKTHLSNSSPDWFDKIDECDWSYLRGLTVEDLIDFKQ